MAELVASVFFKISFFFKIYFNTAFTIPFLVSFFNNYEHYIIGNYSLIPP